MDGLICGWQFAPDGETVYLPVYPEDYPTGTLIEMEVATGRVIRHFTGSDSPCAIALSPDGQTLVGETGIDSEARRFTLTGMRFWDVATGQLIDFVPLDLNQLPADAGEDRCTIVYGDKYLSTHASGLTALWDTSTGQLIQTYRQQYKTGNGCAHLIPAGVLAATVDFETNTAILTLWNETTGELLHQETWEVPGLGSAYALSPDGRTWAFGSDTGLVWLVDLDTWQVTTLYGHGSWLESLNFTPDGRTLVSSSGDNTIRLWNVENAAEISQIQLQGPASAFVISPDGHMAAAQEFSNTEEGRLGLWDLETGELIRPLAYNHRGARNVTFSPDGKAVVSESAVGSCETGGKLYLSEIATGDTIWEVTKAGGIALRTVAFTPDGKWILSGALNCESFVTVWDAATGDKISQWTGHQDSIVSISASLDGKWIGSGSRDKTAILWDAATGTVIYTLPHESIVSTVAFSPDSQLLLTAEQNGNLHLWDVTTGEEVSHFTQHTAGVYFVDFSPDGRYIVSSSAADSNIFVWEVQTGEAVRHFHTPLLGLFGSVVAFSPDGQSIYMSDENNVIRQIDLMLEPGRLMDWIRENRYVRDLTPSECTLYGVEAFCEEQARD